MSQQFEVFQGLPDDLVARMYALKTGGATLVSCIASKVAANYIIFYTAAAPIA